MARADDKWDLWEKRIRSLGAFILGTLLIIWETLLTEGEPRVSVISVGLLLGFGVPIGFDIQTRRRNGNGKNGRAAPS